MPRIVRAHTSAPPPLGQDASALEALRLARREDSDLDALTRRDSLRLMYQHASAHPEIHEALVATLPKLMPRWAAGATLSIEPDRLVITLPDNVTVNSEKIQQQVSAIESALGVQTVIARSERYTKCHTEINSILGEGARFLLKLEPASNSLYVIMPARPREELVALHGEMARRIEMRIHICATINKAKFFTISPPDSTQTERNAAEAKMLQRLIRRRLPRWSNAGISVSPKGVEVHWYGRPMGVGREQHLRGIIAKVTSLPVTIRNIERSDNPRDALHNSAPPGVSVWYSAFFRVTLGESEYRCAVVRATLPKEKEGEILKWRLAIEEKFGIHVVLQSESVIGNLDEKLARLADADGVLRSASQVHQLAQSLLGPSPKPRLLAKAPEPPSRGVITLPAKEFPLIAVDMPDTIDREDAMWARRLPDGTVRALVAYTDASWRIDPHSDEAEHARRVVQTSYRSTTARQMLGRNFDIADLALTAGEERVLWIVDMTINTLGAVEKYQFYRARGTTAKTYSHEEFLSALREPNHIHNDVHQALLLGAQRLQSYRRRARGQLSVSGDTSSHRLVEVYNIVAREKIARFFAKRNIALPYAVLGQPSKRKLDKLIAELRGYGVEASRGTFSSPSKFMELFDTLTKREETRAVGYHMLDTFLLRSQFSASAAPHGGLPADHYLQVKALRTYAGLLFQWQAHRFFQRAAGEPVELLSRAFIEREVRHINRRRATAWQNIVALSTLSALENRLARAGVTTRGIVESLDEMTATTYLPRYGIEATVDLSGKDPATVKVGSDLLVKLDGFRPSSRHYVASLVNRGKRR